VFSPQRPAVVVYREGVFESPPLDRTDPAFDALDPSLVDMPVAGPMALYLGHRIPSRIVRAWDENAQEDDPRYNSVRAFPVVTLVGATVQARGPAGLGAAIQDLLEERLPIIEWDYIGVPPGPLLKYLVLHDSIPAPMDVSTGQPMAIEFYGDVRSIEGVPLDSDEGRQWLAAHRQLYRSLQDSPVARMKILDAVRIEVRIEVATYANVMYTSVGVPFYM
jgi:hypothetical protein